ncbi:hypothetical protein QUA44_25825 [Microcoleus sp. N9_A2]|uniref:hypothetical protein n=1 Tax=unclassified Microcoleus TaxID=2642155 RepID=UPI002FD77F26
MAVIASSSIQQALTRFMVYDPEACKSYSVDSEQSEFIFKFNNAIGVADLRYERLNMPVIETCIDKAWGFKTYFFHTLIKQRQIFKPEWVAVKN